jgi:murein DD-endopeptidase MepM/ murein hydrolase activator NlpD
VELEVKPRSLLQGRTAVVEVAVDGAVAVRGSLGGVAVPLVRSGATWNGFAGVPPDAVPGSLRLDVDADLADGRTIVAQQALAVVDAGYPTENINLSQEVRDRLARNADAIRREREQVNAIWREVTADRLWRGRFILPAQGRYSSHYGTHRSYNGGPVDSFHEGLDIANVVGTPIVAAARGRVVFAQPDLLVRGGAVILDHGLGVHTGYWHQSEVLVRVGEMVEQGQTIGRMGARGMVTGSHLHWDVRVGATPVQPDEWLSRDWSSP